PRRLGIARRKQQRRLVVTAGREQLAADDQKARGVVFRVLDLGNDDVQTVHLRCSLSGYRGRSVLIPRASCSLRIAADGDTLDARQVLIEPVPALRKRLLMRTDSHDLLEPMHTPHQVLMDAQLDLTADLERRGNEHVERIVDGSFRRVLDRDDAEVRMARQYFFEHLADRRQRQRAYGMPEV